MKFIQRKRKETLVETVLGKTVNYDLLKKERTRIDTTLSEMRDTFVKMQSMFFQQKAQYALLNGRIDKISSGLAEDVLNKTELALLELHQSILEYTFAQGKLKEAVAKIELSIEMESKSSSINDFLNSQKFGTGKILVNPADRKSITNIGRTSQHVLHTIDASTELKAGK